jgi:hypothetical protein
LSYPLKHEDYQSLNDILSIVKSNHLVITNDLATKLYQIIGNYLLNLADQLSTALKDGTDISFPDLATGTNTALAAVMSRYIL